MVKNRRIGRPEKFLRRIDNGSGPSTWVMVLLLCTVAVAAVRYWFMLQ